MLGAGFALGLAGLSTLNFLTDRAAAYPRFHSTGQSGDTGPAFGETALVGSPAHLLLVVHGLEVASPPSDPLSYWPGPVSQTSIKVELLLDTRILGERGDQQTYQITSRLVAIDRGETIWSRVYAGELLSRRALRLQLDRAVGDAIMYTKMAERSQLMVRLNRSLTSI